MQEYIHYKANFQGFRFLTWFQFTFQFVLSIRLLYIINMSNARNNQVLIIFSTLINGNAIVYMT